MAVAVLATVLGGVGALGWLVGHVLTYDATGHGHAHRSHGYMQPLQQAGSLVALAGIIVALLGIVVGRAAARRWIDRWEASGSRLPWLLAAAAPASAFVSVEWIEGSLAARGPALLLVGVPLQALIGGGVLALVRVLLRTIVRVVERIAVAHRSALHLGPPSWIPAPACRSLDRMRPMAVNAALRAPPVAWP